MTELEDITYSRSATIAAIRDFYQFLTKVYLNDSQVIHPPEGGWASIIDADPTALESFGKSDEVVSLLAQLPYIDSGDGSRETQVGPNCAFADWQELITQLSSGRSTGEDLRVITEGPDFAEFAAPQAFGLACGNRDTPVLVLDTQLGVVHWQDCPDAIVRSHGETSIGWEWDDDVPEDEANWRSDACTWAIPDFFEVLKDLFRTQHWIPISPYEVWSASFATDIGDAVRLVQDIYRQHGWPDLARYRKSECLEAVRRALREKHPSLADSRE